MAGATGSPIRLVVVGIVTLALGLLLGGLAPRSELRDLRAQLDGQPQKCEKSGIGRQIASAFRGRPWEGGLSDEDRPAAPIDEPVAAPSDEPSENKIEFNFGDGEEGRPKPEDIEEGMDMMRAAMQLRKTQARAALDEVADPSDEQWDSIDAAIADMNSDLKMLAGEFVETIGAGEEPTRREAMLFAADTLEVMLEADDRLYESLTPEQIESMDVEDIDPFAHIDPEIVDIFMELDQK